MEVRRETSGDFSHTLEGINAKEKRFEEGKLDDFIINQKTENEEILWNLWELWVEKIVWRIYFDHLQRFFYWFYQMICPFVLKFDGSWGRRSKAVVMG